MLTPDYYHNHTPIILSPTKITDDFNYSTGIIFSPLRSDIIVDQKNESLENKIEELSNENRALKIEIQLINERLKYIEQHMMDRNEKMEEFRFHMSELLDKLV